MCVAAVSFLGSSSEVAAAVFFRGSVLAIFSGGAERSLLTTGLLEAARFGFAAGGETVVPFPGGEVGVRDTDSSTAGEAGCSEGRLLFSGMENEPRQKLAEIFEGGNVSAKPNTRILLTQIMLTGKREGNHISSGSQNVRFRSRGCDDVSRETEAKIPPFRGKTPRTDPETSSLPDFRPRPAPDPRP